MWHLFDKYKGIVWPKSGQMNLIARILNNLCPGPGIKLNTPTVPSPASPVTIGIDTEWLDDYMGDSDVNANISAADGSGLAVNDEVDGTGKVIDLDGRTPEDTFGIHSLKLKEGSTTVVDAKVLATDDYELHVKHIAGGIGINVTDSNGTITISNTAPCSCSGGGGGSSGSVDEFVGYDGNLVLASLPVYDSASHQLKYTPVTLTFDNGRLVGAVAASSPTVITTAVEET